MLTDTIAAISTPLGEGGIAVIRVSGPDSIASVERIFQSRQKLSEVPTHTLHYGFIIDPASGKKIDEVLVTVMRAPRSFTKEDVVEVHCHGGLISVKKVLETILMGDVRLAEPGEFTKRAFLNGRIDLSQAEAVIDLIRSKSDRAFSVALQQMEGALSKKVHELRHELIQLLAHIEVNIDYPEHDVEEMTSQYIISTCNKVIAEIDTLLSTAEHGKILREGIVTVIVGRPNVGKSSLLNMLSRENRAIVTDIPGTTRDVIEQYVNVGGIPLKLLDTAGIRDSDDLVEQIGVERTKRALSEAELTLFVLNYNEPLNEEEIQLIDELKKKQTIVIINKTDLEQKLDVEEVRNRLKDSPIVMMAIAKDEGLETLEKTIQSMFFSGSVITDDTTVISNTRHVIELKKAKQFLLDAIESAEQFIPIDIIQIDVQQAWMHLGEIVGDAVSDSLIDQIFSQFCLGK